MGREKGGGKRGKMLIEIEGGNRPTATVRYRAKKKKGKGEKKINNKEKRQRTNEMKEDGKILASCVTRTRSLRAATEEAARKGHPFFCE